MKQFFRKTLTVTQIFLYILIPLAVITTLCFIAFESKPVIPETTEKIKEKDTLHVKTTVSDTSASFRRLTSFVDSMNAAPQLFAGSWSYYLVDVDSGKVLSATNIDHGLTPASVMKLVTTGTALSLLGPQYKFSTTIEYDGTLDEATKTLNGNIYIRGSGDPTLGSEVFGSSINKLFNAWAIAIQNLGITKINGSIIGDAEACDQNPIPDGWTWGDMQCDYGAGSCGLNIHENLYDIIFSASKSKVNFTTSPIIPGLKLYNQAVYKPDILKPYAYVQRAPFQFEGIIFGEIRDNHVEHGSIPDPALFCAQTLKSALLNQNIEVTDSSTTMRLVRLNKIKTPPKKDRKLITTTYSPPLKDLVYHTNHVSQNFYAESILQAISCSKNGYGSTSGSVKNIYELWKSRNIDLRGLCMIDGCGLSRMNTITTHQMVDMLRFLAKDTAVFPAFYKSLPIAGESGTIRKLANKSAAASNLRAKSGTMERIKSYAGYVHTKSGKLLCFTMIANNTLWTERQLKEKFEKLFILMAELD